jgi:flagellar protein FlaG
MLFGGLSMSSIDLPVSQAYSPPANEKMPIVGYIAQIKRQAPAPSNLSVVSFGRPIESFDVLKRAEDNGEVIPISDEQLVKAIQKAIKVAEGITTSLEFTVHKETHRISVKVLNNESGEIIREIPPEKSLDFLAALWRKAGILIDEKG